MKDKLKINFQEFEQIKSVRGYLKKNWCIEEENLEAQKVKYYEDSVGHHWFYSKKVRLVESLNYKSDLSLLSVDLFDSQFEYKYTSNKEDSISGFHSGSIIKVDLKPQQFYTYAGFSSDKKIDEIYLLIKKANAYEDESAECNFIQYVAADVLDRLCFVVVLSEEAYARLHKAITNNKKATIKFHAACLGFYSSDYGDEIKLLMSYHKLIVPSNSNIVPSYVGSIEKFGIFIEIEKPDDSYEFILSKNILSIFNQVAKNIVVIKVLLILTFISIFILIILT
jgi:hypothetical protein